MFLNDNKKWEQIRSSEEYKPLRDMICAEYDKNCKDKPIPQITFSLETEFLRTGNRTKFENVYFARRKQLSSCALMALLYPEVDEYIHKLEDVICEICNEYSWQLPAHRPADRFNLRNGIALFSAETGLYLAEIKAAFADRLNPLVTERITAEIKWRITESFKNNTYWFEELKSNWAAVCGGCVGAVFLYEDADGYMEVKPRIEKCMQNYLDGCLDDGSTSEGADYWVYGFSYFVLYNELLRRYTFNRINYFNNDKIKRIAEFFSSLCLDNSNVVSFSDCVNNISYPIWTLEFLNKEYGISMPPIKGRNLGILKFPWAIRSCIYYNPDSKDEKLPPMKKFYDKVQWYIERREKYSFAVKGGHNAEEHNHNDVGSFIVTHNEKVIFIDLGAPEYTAAGFLNESYDSILSKSSLGHSVPIINGQPQKFGREYCGCLKVTDDKVNVEMGKAYPLSISSISRNFELLDDEIMLCDRFDGAETAVERFVTETEPVITENGIFIAGVKIIVDKRHKVSCTYQDILQHDGVTPRRVYLLDFDVCGNEFNMKIVFEG